MLAFTFSQHLGALATLVPGAYATDATRESELDVFLCCPSCGGIDRVSERVEVHPDGTIATWECPTATCGDRLSVRLAGWRQ